MKADCKISARRAASHFSYETTSCLATLAQFDCADEIREAKWNNEHYKNVIVHHSYNLLLEHQILCSLQRSFRVAAAGFAKTLSTVSNERLASYIVSILSYCNKAQKSHILQAS